MNIGILVVFLQTISQLILKGFISVFYKASPYIRAVRRSAIFWSSRKRKNVKALKNLFYTFLLILSLLGKIFLSWRRRLITFMTSVRRYLWNVLFYWYRVKYDTNYHLIHFCWMSHACHMFITCSVGHQVSSYPA